MKKSELDALRVMIDGVAYVQFPIAKLLRKQLKLAKDACDEAREYSVVVSDQLEKLQVDTFGLKFELETKNKELNESNTQLLFELNTLKAAGINYRDLNILAEAKINELKTELEKLKLSSKAPRVSAYTDLELEILRIVKISEEWANFKQSEMRAVLNINTFPPSEKTALVKGLMNMIDNSPIGHVPLCPIIRKILD